MLFSLLLRATLIYKMKLQKKSFLSSLLLFSSLAPCGISMLGGRVLRDLFFRREKGAFTFVVFFFLPPRDSILRTSVCKKHNKSEKIVYYILTRFHVARRKLADYKQCF